MSVCPRCQREITTPEARFCPYCGATISEEGLFEFNAASAPPSTAAEPPTAIEPPAWSAGTAGPLPPPSEVKRSIEWEERSRVGFLRGLSQTWSDASLRPTEFFRRAPRTGNLGSALLFALLVWMTSGLIALFWQSQIMQSFPMLEQFERELGMELGRGQYGLYVLLLPFWMTLTIFFAAAVFHVCLLLVGSGQAGWEATFRALCYSFGPQLLAVLPVCGGFVAMFWQLGILLIGWREFHQSAMPRVLLAAMLPLFLCCGLVSYALFRFADFLSHFNNTL
ncbi:MAG: YIP1 family protein [candidate division KSB1 bacterium]|nr:YIP1 family protein [candidate division KSB1 bacterium]MDZ7276441.1 YIP1 family protein [candidate division KSB1 bacterium]MDZ7288111.1 YIP1 family protein [candidate division KSB1 bacterium]MDZ7300212.1 YIP1 family protein [candidate division KSB1 bacterium]MDZ7305783.1 YIP1 family protein [candidate division KSB1 bacterium]